MWKSGKQRVLRIFEFYMAFFWQLPRYACFTLIQLYRWMISPLLGQRCRFYPSCSAYAQQVIMKYGLLYGIWLSLIRLSKCHPGHPGGFDIP